MSRAGWLAVTAILALAPACQSIRDLVFDDDSEPASSSKAKKKKTAEEAQEAEPKIALPPIQLPTAFPTNLPTPSRVPVGSKYDYFSSQHALTILPKLQERAGPKVTTLKINVHPDHVIAELRDPKDKTRVLRHILREGAWVREPEPVRRTGNESEAKLDEAMFDAVEVDWTAIPAMVNEARAKMTFLKPVVTHLSASRFLPFDKNVQVRVFITGDLDKSGYVDFDPKGHLKKVKDG